jgi:hypothetical protein
MQGLVISCCLICAVLFFSAAWDYMLQYWVAVAPTLLPPLAIDTIEATDTVGHAQVQDQLGFQELLAAKAVSFCLRLDEGCAVLRPTRHQHQGRRLLEMAVWGATVMQVRVRAVETSLALQVGLPRRSLS